MTILSFDYLKKDATVAEPKVIVPLVNPSDKYFGVDITELDPEDQGLISTRLAEAKRKYTEDVENIMTEYDIKHNYRYYFDHKMSNIVVDN